MTSIITEARRFRKRACKYAIKYQNYVETARKYHTSR